VLAITLPAMVFSRLGYASVGDASVAGMMAVASGLFFVAALLLGPRYGLASRLVHQTRLGLRVATEDILGMLYRREEDPERENSVSAASLAAAHGVGPWLSWLALRRLAWSGAIERAPSGFTLTTGGRRRAEELVRAHRLWESYMARHFELPEDHLHEAAAWVEHYLDPALRARLAAELDSPLRDPHGRSIPEEGTASAVRTGEEDRPNSAA
jgi:Mn-dependent DtxR family transcriptional regulator